MTPAYRAAIIAYVRDVQSSTSITRAAMLDLIVIEFAVTRDEAAEVYDAMKPSR